MVLLAEAGADRIRADTLVRNRAMQRALRQAGFDRGRSVVLPNWPARGHEQRNPGPPGNRGRRNLQRFCPASTIDPSTGSALNTMALTQGREHGGSKHGC